MFLDKVIINIKSGDGGKGVISFNQDSKNSRGGPDGGNGGHGGSVWIKKDSNISDLKYYGYKKSFSAKSGGDGKSQNKSGINGEDLILSVPEGTYIWEKTLNSNNLLAVMSESTELLEIIKGGRGGRGNVNFASSKNKEPLLAEAGEKQESVDLELDLRIQSDCCIIGPPNVGKSTFINNVSNAKPEIANYLFTTKEPILAVTKRNFQNIRFVELPGVISNEKENYISGNNFFKHLQNTKILAFMVDIEMDISSEIKKIEKVLKDFNKFLLKKEIIILISKSNKLEEIDRDILKKELSKKLPKFKNNLFFISDDLEYDLELFLSKVLKSINNYVPSNTEEDIPTLNLENKSKKRIIKNNETFIINDKQFMQLADGSDLTNWKTLVQFQFKLKSSKISEELVNMGIKKGNHLRVSDYEFTWEG
ncbi:MAG: Obg family GTPase CgtA [Dehalococcoidales bacterium]|jgi:GTPase|nr:Obg family GTPase CgtA [Dehalococcoidia bacterium]NCG34406.1 Obg family GTPase CgtA [Dehalococcoidales bacterium]